jgi:hypothetical protein
MSTRDETNLKRLSDKQQLLLSRFHDGECGYVESILAKRLISRNPDAVEFCRRLDSIRECCLSELSFTTKLGESVNLWDRISTRIDQESRAELYLGKRRIEQKKESVWERFSSPYALAGGLSGAALAAVLLVVSYRSPGVTTFTAPHMASTNQFQLVRPVAMGAGSAGSPTTLRVPSVGSPSSLEVDWVRSQGSLKLIPDPNGSSAIIWVRRKPIPNQEQRLRAPTIRSVTGARALSAAGTLVKTPPPSPRLDVQGLIGRK